MPREMSLEEEFFARAQASGVVLDPVNRIKGKLFCFTGKLESMTRDGARALVDRAEGSWNASVTNSVQILVAGSIPRTAIIAGSLSLKLQKARRLGVDIISEETFLQMVKDAGVY